MDGWGLCKDLGALAEQLKGPRELMGRVVFFWVWNLLCYLYKHLP